MTLRAIGLAALTALSLSACQTPGGPGELDSPARQGHVIVVPLNVSVRAPEMLDGELGPVWSALLDHVHTQYTEVTVIPRVSAEQLWLAASDNLDFTDRRLALQTASSDFARQLAEHQPYDLLVIPTLVLRPAIMNGRYASWDGVRRLVPNGDGVIASSQLGAGTQNSVHVAGLNGTVAATSIHVAVYRPDGALDHEGLGALDLIQEAQRDGTWESTWKFELRRDPFANSEHVNKGIGDAFAQRVR
jgi:hypothetical protein